MNLHTYKVIIVIFVMSFLSCNGQAKNVTTEKFHNEIVQEFDDSIWVVFQDSKGNYWFGSNGEGVYRYDGENLKLFTTDDGLINNSIRGIQEDKFGNLFIETTGGISVYDGTTLKTLEPISSPSNEWKLEKDDLWFGYNANDLYRYDGIDLYELKLPRQNLSNAFGIETYGVPFESNNKSTYAVYGIDIDKEGNVWIGTVTAGAFMYDGNSILWIGEKELSTLPDGRVPGVRSMLQDKNGYYWLSNFKSKYKIDKTLKRGYEILESVPNVKDIYGEKLPYFNSGLVDDEGNLWMTTYGGGVWKYDGETLSNIEVNNNTETVLLISIFQDSDGVIWLGSNNDGVYKQNGSTFEKFIP